MKKLIFLVAAAVVAAMAGMLQGHFIVVAQTQQAAEADAQLQQCQQILSQEHIDGVKAEMVPYEQNYLIRVGPFEQGSAMAVAYYKLKKHFPQAFILEQFDRKRAAPVKPAAPKVITREVVVEVEKVDKTLWTALFGLAIIGVLYMFLSSDQIRRIRASQKRMKEKYKALEEKQHQVLSSMGENIHTIAKETITQTNKLVEKSKETALHDEIKQVMYNEHELLDVTDDLIKFLRLKSKKVVVQNEVFNLNNVLNEVIGSLQETASKKQAELVFDIDTSVPQNIMADSAHLGQILISLLEYYVQHSKDGRVYFGVTLLSGLTEKMRLQCNIVGNVRIADKEDLFEARYDERNRKYVRLGLFVAKELVELMGGEIIIHSKGGRDTMEVVLPIEEAGKEKRQYRLAKKEIMNKRILIIEKSKQEAEALAKRFSYFRMQTEIVQPRYLIEKQSSLSRYDLLVIDRDLLTQQIESLLVSAYQSGKGPKIIVSENLYKRYLGEIGEWVASTIQKPFSPSYILETLNGIFDPEEKEKQPKREKKSQKTLPVYRDTFASEPEMSLEKFERFAGKGLLLVEDNLINQKVIEGVLSKSGMTILVAANGKEALEILEREAEQIDLILMDINMPVMDGFVCTEQIRNRPCYAEIPIVALTALVADHEISKMFDLGMNGYLSKPLKVEQLYTAMRMFLGESSQKVVQNKAKSLPQNLPGLHVDVGLANMQHNQVFYREVLREFMDAYAQSDQALEEYISQKRYGQARILCLDMKGLTETIGAHEMFDVVSEIHKYLTLYHHMEHADSYIAKYRETLQILKESIKTFLKE